MRTAKKREKKERKKIGTAEHIKLIATFALCHIGWPQLGIIIQRVELISRILICNLLGLVHTDFGEAK